MKPVNKLLINDGNRLELVGKFWLIPTDEVKQSGDWCTGFKVVGCIDDWNLLYQRQWAEKPKLLKKISDLELRGYVGEAYIDGTCFEMEY